MSHKASSSSGCGLDDSSFRYKLLKIWRQSVLARGRLAADMTSSLSFVGGKNTRMTRAISGLKSSRMTRIKESSCRLYDMSRTVSFSLARALTDESRDAPPLADPVADPALSSAFTRASTLGASACTMRSISASLSFSPTSGEDSNLARSACVYPPLRTSAPYSVKRRRRWRWPVSPRNKSSASSWASSRPPMEAARSLTSLEGVIFSGPRCVNCFKT